MLDEALQTFHNTHPTVFGQSVTDPDTILSFLQDHSRHNVAVGRTQVPLARLARQEMLSYMAGRIKSHLQNILSTEQPLVEEVRSSG